MAIKRPDIYEHNNPNLAIVDSDFVRGGGRVVANLTELYALTNKIDQLKERVTKVYVISEEITYVLVNKLDITAGVFNSTAWEEEFSGGMSTVYTDGTTITGDGSQANPLIAQIPEETDPVFNSSQAKNITSTHISVLNNTSGTNTGDETSETIKSKLGISVLSGSNTGDQDLSGYSVASHNHSLSSLSEKSYNSLTDKPTIPSIAGLMVESEYVGQGASKSVALAEEALYSEKADKDSFGRIIHDTYALKDSGITPPETETITLINASPVYTVTNDTSPALIVINNATENGEIYLSGELESDKSITIQIFGNDTLISSHNGSNTYQDEDTVFASFEVATATWFVTDTEPTVIPDYSDMTVDVMLENPSITPKSGYIYVSGAVFTINTLVFIKSTSTPSQIGIYKVFSAIAGGSNMYLIAAGTALHTVRVKGGDVWYSQYDGANAGTLVFKSGALWTREIIPLVCSDEVSDITASTTVPKLRFVFPASFSLISIFAEMNVAPVGGTFTIDIKKNGTSVFSTLLTFDSGEASTRTATTPYVLIAPLSFVLGDYIEVFVTLAGTVTAGKGLKVYLLTNKIA